MDVPTNHWEKSPMPTKYRSYWGSNPPRDTAQSFGEDKCECFFLASTHQKSLRDSWYKFLIYLLVDIISCYRLVLLPVERHM